MAKREESNEEWKSFPFECVVGDMVRFLVFLSFFACLSAWAEYPPAIPDAQVETYRKVDEVELKVWILGQEEGEVTEAKPAVILFFGGAWRFGSPDSLLRHARYLTAKGMICLLADYRVATRHGTRVADCVADAKAAVAWTRKNAKRLGIVPDKIAAGGASAGGHLAACSALVPGFGNEEKPNALLLFNSPLILSPFQGDDFGVKYRLSAQFLGAEPEAVSPIHHLSKSVPPTWMTHGSVDGLVPIRSAKTFRDQMLALGRECVFLEAKGENHAFHYQDPWFTKVMVGMEAFLVGLGWIEEDANAARTAVKGGGNSE